MRPVRDEPDQDHHLDGLQSLCRSCHFEKTARENHERLNLSPAEILAADRWKRLVDELA